MFNPNIFERFYLESAKLIGEPINESLPVPMAISEIADVSTAEAGEHVYRFDDLDEDVDQILDVNTTTGAITVVKVSPIGDTELTFKHLNSKLQYILVSAILDSPDQGVLGRKKSRISASMDKLELRAILDAILGGTTPTVAGGTHDLEDDIAEVALASGEDIYDYIVKMKHALEDYGDSYALLCGSGVKEAIDNYDKLQSETSNYNVNLPGKLRELGIKVIKVFGTVKWTSRSSGASGSGDDTSATALLNTAYCIMVARNSTIANGKPIKFIRRKINPEIAKLMGADVDKAQRALLAIPTPVNNEGTNAYAFGVYGAESIIWAITNPKCIKYSPTLAAII